MRSLLQNPLWQRAKKIRSYQHFFGLLSGVLLTLGLVALFDGLIAQMRSGNNELELLPGEAVTVSGPAALKNPLASDVKVTFRPDDAPLVFELEGFFTGYWFGSGMWRGRISAREDARPGKYELRIAFRGASALKAQKYLLVVFADARARREASLSFLRRHLAINPFWLAAWAGGLGILGGSLTYLFGRRFAACLQSLGLAEIYAQQGPRLWCLAPKALVPPAGNARMVLTDAGLLYGEAQVQGWHKGKMQLVLLDQPCAPKNGFICLKHPAEPVGAAHPARRPAPGAPARSSGLKRVPKQEQTNYTP